MKVPPKESPKTIWDQMRTASGNPITGGPGSQPTRTSTTSLPKLMIWLILFVSLTYVVYTLKLVSNSRAVICRLEQQPFPSDHHLIQNHTTTTTTTTTLLASIPRRESQEQQQQETEDEEEDEESRKPTSIRHIVFGIAASAKLWEQRKNYIKIWYNKSQEMRGIVWLDDVIKQPKYHQHQQQKIQEEQVLDDNDDDSADSSLPPIKISGDTSKFAYTNKQGHRSAIRISRIVSETLRLGLPNVRWFVMGDDDTVFITENLVRVLRKYDHNQYYYIGSSSESHLQNIYFSYAMAYGGGGFAISYPLAKALDKMQDRCIQRYPGLYGSDDRMQACMAELGVPLTKEVGFHQYDVYGNLFGLLAAHPVTPLVSLHHLDVVEPIFPDVTRVQALRWLMTPMKMDSAGLMQQSIGYDKSKRWTISVSWGFAVQIFRGVFSPREIEMPSRTFLNWYRRADYTAYAFNTRPVSRNPCQKPFVFYLSKATFNSTTNLTVTEYSRHHIPHPECKWKMADPAKVDTIVVHKKPDPHLWDRSPRRNCCRVKSRKKESMMIEVGVCKEGDVSEV